MITTLSASKKFDWNLPLTKKVSDVMRAFGLTVQRLKANAIIHECTIKIEPGQIIYLTGASGSGKSVLLREFYKKFRNESKINIDDIPLPIDKSCVDCIEGGFLETLKTLSNAGLTDVFCVLNSPANLSEGQKYRYRIAKAIASSKQFIFADEFCSNLDRVTAAVISHNIRKIAAKTKKNFILASAHDDLLADLLPDVIVIRHLAGDAEIIYKNS
jgi:ABC-type ATPase with predicted acetyltransferase domain